MAADPAASVTYSLWLCADKDSDVRHIAVLYHIEVQCPDQQHLIGVLWRRVSLQTHAQLEDMVQQAATAVGAQPFTPHVTLHSFAGTCRACLSHH